MRPDAGPILLVEEDPEDAHRVRRALEDLQVTSPLIHFKDGARALAHLRQSSGRPPWFVLLSVGTPQSKEISFLGSLKSDNTLRSIPVILMASSYHQNTVTESFKLGAAGYMVRSCEPSQLGKTIRAIVQYWTLCAWPPGNGD